MFAVREDGGAQRRGVPGWDIFTRTNIATGDVEEAGSVDAVIGGFIGGVEEFIEGDWVVAVDETNVMAHGNMATCVCHGTEGDGFMRTFGVAELRLVHDVGNEVVRQSIGEAEYGRSGRQCGWVEVRGDIVGIGLMGSEWSRGAGHATIVRGKHAWDGPHG